MSLASRLRLLFAYLALCFSLGALPSLASARDSLGIYGNWGAFRDADAGKCYAIAKAKPSRLARDYDPYATISTWPRKGVRNQVYFRLSRKMAKAKAITLIIAGKRYALTGSGGSAWAPDKRSDAAITAAMRSASSMTVGASDANGRRFSNTYDLTGAATAMDAALVGCAGQI